METDSDVEMLDWTYPSKADQFLEGIRKLKAVADPELLPLIQSFCFPIEPEENVNVAMISVIKLDPDLQAFVLKELKRDVNVLFVTTFWEGHHTHVDFGSASFSTEVQFQEDVLNENLLASLLHLASQLYPGETRTIVLNEVHTPFQRAHDLLLEQLLRQVWFRPADIGNHVSWGLNFKITPYQQVIPEWTSYVDSIDVYNNQVQPVRPVNPIYHRLQR